MIFLFALIFGSVYFLPIVFALIRAKSFGLKLNFKQAQTLTKDKCLHKDFLIGLRDIWDIYPFELHKLTDHYLAGGDFKNIKKGLLEFRKRNREPNEWFLTTFDLAKRDLANEISKAEKNDWKYEL
ncbi:hypothetical protein PEPS_37610 (plasmid) [Persicobacter psychrovividus]|uniref:Uncharacterized protein n=2 Tax=Persicobacter psychrovividus TaxID=387638 RepID=A0ABM7VKG9_9BACT|nr:hypothetical protein PEPS_37610 [Persicobacter psychrovividus]